MDVARYATKLATGRSMSECESQLRGLYGKPWLTTVFDVQVDAQTDADEMLRAAIDRLVLVGCREQLRAAATEDVDELLARLETDIFALRPFNGRPASGVLTRAAVQLITEVSRRALASSDPGVYARARVLLEQAIRPAGFQKDEYAQVASCVAELEDAESRARSSNLKVKTSATPTTSSRDRAGGPTPTDDAIRSTAREAVAAATRWVRRAQNLDGGLPATDIGSLSCAWATAGLLWAAGTATAGESPGWSRRGLTWLFGELNNDGGVPITSKGETSVTDASAQAVLAVVQQRDAEDELVGRAAPVLDWLLSVREAGGGWAWKPGAGPCTPISTAYAIFALADVDSVLPSADYRLALDEASDWLVEVRNDDLGWGPLDGEPSHPAATALAAAALSRTDRSLSGDSLAFVAEQLEADGWRDLIERPAGHTVIRWSTPLCIYGLATAGGKAVEPTLLKGVHPLLGAFTGRHFQYRDTKMHSWPTRDGILALVAYIAATAKSESSAAPLGEHSE